jgi:hypothetical protein
VRTISVGLRSLNSLCLSGCAGIADDVSLSPMPCLQRLSLYDCHAITAVSCLALVLAAPKLARSSGSSSDALAGATIERCGQLLDLQVALGDLLQHHLRCDAISGILRIAPTLSSMVASAPAPLHTGSGVAEMPETRSDPFEGLSPLRAAQGFGELRENGEGGIGQTRSAAALEALIHALPYATQRIMTADDSPTTLVPSNGLS